MLLLSNYNIHIVLQLNYSYTIKLLFFEVILLLLLFPAAITLGV